eukprot:384688-Pelagomonas_calceolata.AAC.11
MAVDPSAEQGCWIKYSASEKSKMMGFLKWVKVDCSNHKPRRLTEDLCRQHCWHPLSKEQKYIGGEKVPYTI